jgi:hypothetical protein
MNDRIHRYLDGELPLEELTPDERRLAQDHRRLLDQAVPILRQVSAPDVTGVVMGRIAAGTRGRAAAPAPNRLRWLLEPRPVRIRPVYGVLAAAALLLVVLLPRGGDPVVDQNGEAIGVAHQDPDTEGLASRDPGSAESITVFVQFRLEAPSASDVRLAGSFTGWEPRYELRETGPGMWSVLVPLSPGVHDYAFVVDGRDWVPDPVAPTVDDGFGGENSRLALLLSNGGRES